MWVVAGLWVGAAALAQTPEDPLVKQGWRPVLAAGLTTGGDVLAQAQYSNGRTGTLVAGGQIHLYAGLRRQFGSWVVQSNVGYQFDGDSQPNGNESVNFGRFPLELLTQYQTNEVIWVGVGLRKVTEAHVTSRGAVQFSGDVSSGVTLTADPGVFVEGDYALTPTSNLSVRLVRETYQGPRGTRFRGDHLGVFVKGIF